MLFRLTSLILTILLLTGLASAAAQDGDEEATLIRIDGSLLMEDLMQGLADGFLENVTNIPVEFAIDTNGPNAAFEALCAGDLDIVMSSRFVTDEELTACAETELIENLVAFQGLVVLASPDVQQTVACLSLIQLDQLYGLPAEGSETDVTQLDPSAESAPLTVYGPAGTAADLLQLVLPSGELRSDLQSIGDPALLNEGNAIAVMTLPEFDSLESELTPMEITGPSGSCYGPSLPNFETRNYPAQLSLMLYVSADQAEEGAFGLFLQYISTEDGAPAIAAETGFTAASGASYGRNLNNLTLRATGRTYSRASAPVAITTASEGEVTIGGSALSEPLATALSSTFTTAYANATINTNLFGTAPGIEALCSGETEVIFTAGSAEVSCDEIGVYSAEIGTQANVFAVVDASEIPACITVDALAMALAAPVQEPGEEIPLDDERETPRGILNWNELGADFPDLPLTVFLPGRSSVEVDQVLAVAGLAGSFSRSSDEENVFYGPLAAGNPGLWRAAAVSNLNAGGLTVLSWNDYQISEHQSALRLLEIDGGDGCVAPSEETFADGSYAFATRFSVHLSRAAMGQPVVAAFMWSILSEESLTQLDSLNLVNTNADDLRLRRDDVFTLIEEAQEIAAAEAEAEAEATAEATEDAPVDGDAATETPSEDEE
jgi:phosphate transport system substrate-binding protein